MSTTRSGISSRILGTGLLSAETSREGDRATTLELFFDLVYAFAFTQVTALMVHNETATGVLQGLVVLLLLWGPWASFAWLANQAHADRGGVRIGMVAAIRLRCSSPSLSVIGDVIIPGAMQLTVTPRLAVSAASDFVMPISAAFAAA